MLNIAKNIDLPSRLCNVFKHLSKSRAMIWVAVNVVNNLHDCLEDSTICSSIKILVPQNSI
jgi:hypothetical protein